MWLVAAAVLFAGTTGLMLRYIQESEQQLSVKPELAYSNLELEPVESNIGLHAQLPYRSLSLAAEHATAATVKASGKLCRTSQCRWPRW